MISLKKLVTFGNSKQIQVLVDNQCIQPLCGLLESKEEELALETLEKHPFEQNQRRKSLCQDGRGRKRTRQTLQT